MKIIEDMVDGKAHIGAIQLAGIPLDEEPEEEEAMEGDSDDGSGRRMRRMTDLRKGNLQTMKLRRWFWAQR